MKKYWLISCLFACLTLSYGQQGRIPWNVSTPEKQGMSSLTLINGINKLLQDRTNIHSLLVIRNDRIVLDVCFPPFRKEYIHDLASVTKSITSLLIGIAIDKGYIKNEDMPVISFFPEYNTTNDTLKKLKIKDLLNMAAGLKCSWNDGEKELYQMRNSPDWTGFIFNLPFVTLPGERFSYCSGNFYLLAEIVQRATKMTCLEFARQNLFKPLHFGESYWPQNYRGVNHGWGDLCISEYDMAKIGSLILNNGKWNSKQLVSKEWINKIKPLYKIQRTESYGYGWWLDSENPDEIQAVGRGGQRLFAFRERNIIIATTGGGFEAGDLDNLVLESVKSFNKNEDHSAKLDSLVKAIQSPTAGRKDAVSTDFPSSLLNKSYQFEKNDFNLLAIRFELRNKEYYIVIESADGTIEEHPVGMNNQYITSNAKVSGLPVALKGIWEINKLIIWYNELSRINLYKYTFTFNDNSVDLEIRDLTNDRNGLVKGSISE